MVRSVPGVAAASLLAASLFGEVRASASAPAGRDLPVAEIASHGVAPGRPGCSACHLENGAGQPEVGIPRIAGLPRSYIQAQLEYFAAGSRHNTAMAPYARMLSTGERDQIAAYYARMPAPPAEPLPSPPPALGESIALSGVPDTGVPSCSQCHGISGLGVGDFSPPIAGQSASYIQEQLLHWHGGAMRDPKGEFMRAEAGHLTGDEMKAVATYYASLPNVGDRPK